MNKKINNDVETYLFCGTYAKEEKGIKEGKKMNISSYRNLQEFILACKEIHNDEENPRFIFKNAYGIFSELIETDFIYEDIFRYYIEFETSELIPLSYFISKKSWAYSVKNYDVYRDCFERAYMGKYKDFTTFIFDYLNVNYDEFPKELLQFLDFDCLIAELFDPCPSIGQFICRSGHIFRSIL